MDTRQNLTRIKKIFQFTFFSLFFIAVGFIGHDRIDEFKNIFFKDLIGKRKIIFYFTLEPGYEMQIAATDGPVVSEVDPLTLNSCVGQTSCNIVSSRQTDGTLYFGYDFNSSTPNTTISILLKKSLSFLPSPTPPSFSMPGVIQNPQMINQETFPPFLKKSRILAAGSLDIKFMSSESDNFVKILNSDGTLQASSFEPNQAFAVGEKGVLYPIQFDPLQKKKVEYGCGDSGETHFKWNNNPEIPSSFVIVGKKMPKLIRWWPKKTDSANLVPHSCIPPLSKAEEVSVLPLGLGYLVSSTAQKIAPENNLYTRNLHMFQPNSPCQEIISFANQGPESQSGVNEGRFYGLLEISDQDIHENWLIFSNDRYESADFSAYLYDSVKGIDQSSRGYFALGGC